MSLFDFEKLNKIADDFLLSDEEKKRRNLSDLKEKFDYMVLKLAPVKFDIKNIDKLCKKLHCFEFPENLTASSKKYCTIGIGTYNGFWSLEFYPSPQVNFKDICLIITENGLTFFDMNFLLAFPVESAKESMLKHCIELMVRFERLYPSFANKFTDFILEYCGEKKKS